MKTLSRTLLVLLLALLMLTLVVLLARAKTAEAPHGGIGTPATATAQP